MSGKDWTTKEKLDYIIVDYHLDAEKALAGKTKHYPSIVEARSKIIALITEGLKKQIDIKREYAFAESLFGGLEHQERMQAAVNTYDVVLKLIKDIGGKE